MGTQNQGKWIKNHNIESLLRYNSDVIIEISSLKNIQFTRLLKSIPTLRGYSQIKIENKFFNNIHLQ